MLHTYSIHRDTLHIQPMHTQRHTTFKKGEKEKKNLVPFKVLSIFEARDAITPLLLQRLDFLWKTKKGSKQEGPHTHTQYSCTCTYTYTCTYTHTCTHTYTRARKRVYTVHRFIYMLCIYMYVGVNM